MIYSLLFCLWVVGQNTEIQGDELLIKSTPTSEDGTSPAGLGESQVFDYTYNPFGKRDPFESFLRGKAEERVLSDNPLLNFDLSKFKLVGIVWGMANPRAIVLDGDGKGHIIRNGTRIGRNRGRVMRILKDRVVVAEEFRDPLGKLSISEHSIMLNPEEQKFGARK
jgi:Tfp pilus assembly protein PilP